MMMYVTPRLDFKSAKHDDAIMKQFPCFRMWSFAVCLFLTGSPIKTILQTREILL